MIGVKRKQDLALLHVKLQHANILKTTVSNIKLDLGPSSNSVLTEEQLIFTEEIEVTPPLNKRKALDDITNESSYNKRPVSRSSW